MRAKNGFTLIELLIVIAIIGILIALLLPAVNGVREAARRTQCKNNLKQVGLAHQHYHESRGTFPIGCMDSPGGGWGHSWWVELLPYIEQENIYEQLDLDATTNETTGVIYEDVWQGVSRVFNTHNGQLLAGIHFPMMTCPSSPMPWKVMDKGTIIPGPEGITGPMYTGIAGAVDDLFADQDANTNWWDATGKLSKGGVLYPYDAIEAGHIKDGTTHTIMVGEQSDYCVDADGNRYRCTSDWYHGFVVGKRPDETRWWNVTVVRYRINDKTWENTGVASNPGHPTNRPIQSAHPGGAHVLLCDGSVRFLPDNTELQLLYDLSNRDDGHVIGAF